MVRMVDKVKAIQEADRIAAELRADPGPHYKFAYDDVMTACDMRTHGLLGTDDLHRLTYMVQRRLRKPQ
jgi:hypothetical protein